MMYALLLAAQPSAMPAEEPFLPLDPIELETEFGIVKPIAPPKPPEQPKPPTAQLLLRSSVLSTSNLTTLKGFAPSATVLENNVMLLVTPRLGDSTTLITTLSAGQTSFTRNTETNYHQWGVSAALQQRLAPNMYVQGGWSQDQLYRNSSGDRLLRDHALQALIGRQDTLSNQLRLDTAYEFRMSFSNPDDQSRVSHTIGGRLRYDWAPHLETAIDYRFSVEDYRKIGRNDTKHQVSASATYHISPEVFLNGTVSYLFGRSSDVSKTPDNFSLGVTLGANLPLF
jgi:Putative beta-barrel porin 2